MLSIENIKKLFDLLPIDDTNRSLYQNLLRLDISVYKPLIEEILEGRMDIEDTRPIFSSYFPSSKNSFTKKILEKRRLITSPEEFKQNLITRLVSPEKNIREIVLLSNEFYEIKREIIEKYEKDNSVSLSSGEKNALFIAYGFYEKTDLDYYGNKEKQTKLSDLMSSQNG